jgi:hypothetical protein
LRRQPATVALPVLAEFLRDKLGNKRWMQKEFGAWVYIRLHVEPTILQWRCAQRFADADPATWAPIRDGLREWLRATIGWLAVTGCWGPGRSWIEAESKRGPGARLFVGKGDFGGRSGGGPHCVLAGKRSWDWLGSGWYEGFWPPILLSSLGLGERHGGDVWLGHKQFLDSIESFSVGPLDIISADERARVLAATHNDIDALAWCVTELIRDWLPAEPVVIVRAESGVSCTLLDVGKSSTATVYHSGWDSDGTTYVAGADPGWRGGKAQWIEPGHAEIDLAARTGWCERTQGDPVVRVHFPLPQGALVAVLEAQFGVGIKLRTYRNGVEVVPIPPASPVVPAPKPPSWLDKHAKGAVWGD